MAFAAESPKPRLISYDWLPGHSMDQMALFVPEADPCWQRLYFYTRTPNGSRLRGTFLLSSVHFDAPESNPASAEKRVSEDIVATTSTGFIREINLTLVEGDRHIPQYRPVHADSGQISLELGASTRTQLTLDKKGKTYGLRVWMDCGKDLTRCRIKSGEISQADHPEGAYKFSTSSFDMKIEDACVRLP